MYDKLMETDPDYTERFAYFLEEVKSQKIAGESLDNRTRMMAILASLIGCQGIEEFKELLPEAFDANVTPIEIKEIVYQATAYLGMGRVRPFLTAVNDCFYERGITLPLESQETTTIEDRLVKGSQVQVEIFGEGMKEFYKSGPEETRHINYWLASNCFGDYYTRGGLTVRQREMITFCYIAALGGCEPQLTAHASGNLKVGNDETFLLNVVSQCVPYIGYPRSLNAIRCIKEAASN